MYLDCFPKCLVSVRIHLKPDYFLLKSASAFFTHGYFQQAHAHISEAIITD